MNLWDITPGHCEEVPQITYYPSANKKTDATVVIFPGGAYAIRAEHEGKGYAELLNGFGVDAFVIDYRVKPHIFPIELLDARRGVRFVRHHAAEYGINPEKIAVMGSSAGGHLAALLSTYTEPIDFEDTDDIDKENYMPNAQILCYPVICSPNPENVTHFGSYENLLGSERLPLADKYNPEFLVTEATPQAFIWHTANDGGVNVINSYRYATALRNFNVPAEMHIFPNGNHGLGVAANNPHVAQWTGLLEKWLCFIGWLD